MSSSVITQSPEVLGGEPVFAGTRVPVKSLFDHLEAGDSIEDFLDGFPSVRREQVITLLGEMKARVLPNDPERAAWLAQSGRSLCEVWGNEGDDFFNELLSQCAGPAADSVPEIIEQIRALPANERDALVAFVKSLKTQSLHGPMHAADDGRFEKAAKYVFDNYGGLLGRLAT